MFSNGLRNEGLAVKEAVNSDLSGTLILYWSPSDCKI